MLIFDQREATRFVIPRFDSIVSKIALNYYMNSELTGKISYVIVCVCVLTIFNHINLTPCVLFHNPQIAKAEKLKPLEVELKQLDKLSKTNFNVFSSM